MSINYAVFITFIDGERMWGDNLTPERAKEVAGILNEWGNKATVKVKRGKHGAWREAA
jgi:hypothetical protein